jgi:tRNA(His) 5'-end guanylyltransferase
MSVNDELGKRMKENYEQISKYKLTRRLPVIIRIDGKAFHTFTRGFKKPFDEIFIKSMQNTMKFLCENIQGAVFAYTQSDEISILLCDYKRLNSAAWFDNEVQKMCSISASMATLEFNRKFLSLIYENRKTDDKTYQESLHKAFQKGAMFDSRCFTIPESEVANYFYWRQLDATRNSIEMVGHCNFSQKELHKKTCNQIQDMLHEQKGINWNDFPTHLKRGSCCYKINKIIGENGRSKWVIDEKIPIFVGINREYIERWFMDIEK